MAIQFYNGEFLPREAIKFSVEDLGILRGYAMFDFFRMIEGVPIFLEDHLDRFENSARILGMEIPFSREKMSVVIHELGIVNNLPLSYIKMVMTGGDTPDGFSPGRPNLAILNDVLQSPPEEKFTEGVTLLTCDYTRDFPEAKSTHYTMAVKLQPKFKEGGHEDVLYHSGGLVSEVSRSNVFFFKNNKLITNQEGVLQGITRMKVLELAKESFEVELRDFSIDELLKADEMFMTGTNKKVMPVVALDDRPIANGKVGENSKLLLSDFRTFVDDYVRERKAKSTQGFQSIS